jgi:putative endopeptidase
MSISPESAFSMDGFNREVNPGDNFFQYVNGSWLNNNKIPDDYNSWGTFEVLMEENLLQQKKMLNSFSENDFDAKLMRKFWDLSDNIFQTENIDELNNYTQKMVLHDHNSVFKLLGYLASFQLCPFFSFFNSQDAKNTDINLPHFYSGGLGLPDRDYYFDEGKEDIRVKYRAYVTNYLNKLDLNISLEQIYTSEELLANVHFTKVEKRDPNKTYHSYTLEELYDNFGKEMEEYLNATGYFDYWNDKKKTNSELEHKFIIDNPQFYKTLFKFIRETPKEIIYGIIRWKFSNSYGALFSKELDDLHFDFYKRTLSGQKKQKVLWKRQVGLINSYLGELVGKFFTEKYFDKSAKESALKMVTYVQRAFEKRLRNLEWLENETINKALDKFSIFKVKIGYPNEWRDYKNLNILNCNNIVEAIMLINSFDFERELLEMYQEPDWERWEMNPQDINAYYHPLKNEIVFPAGILQPPFFSPKFDPPVNFGGIGAVIAHEITHGFDDQGRKFDKKGNLTDWWSETDQNKFENCIKRIKEQFSNEVICGENVNGELTCGENIADDGGLKISYDAMQLYFKENERSTSFQGFTPEQRFFLSWATVWKGLIREEHAKQLIKIDPHSPRILRVNTTVSNFDKFYEAFNINENTKLYKKNEERFKLW